MLEVLLCALLTGVAIGAVATALLFRSAYAQRLGLAVAERAPSPPTDLEAPLLDSPTHAARLQDELSVLQSRVSALETENASLRRQAADVTSFPRLSHASSSQGIPSMGGTVQPASPFSIRRHLKSSHCSSDLMFGVPSPSSSSSGRAAVGPAASAGFASQLGARNETAAVAERVAAEVDGLAERSSSALQVTLDNFADDACTVVRVSAPNRARLLADLSTALSGLGLSIVKARISTVRPKPPRRCHDDHHVPARPPTLLHLPIPTCVLTPPPPPLPDSHPDALLRIPTLRARSAPTPRPLLRRWARARTIPSSCRRWCRTAVDGRSSGRSASPPLRGGCANSSSGRCPALVPSPRAQPSCPNSPIRMGQSGWANQDGPIRMGLRRAPLSPSTSMSLAMRLTA